jgi:uncharacterized protein (DUF58 family)
MSGLLPAGLLQRLERLQVLARRTFRGTGAGERRSRQVGSWTEFRDHREYAPGDDLRHLDWNAFARLERLYLKRFHAQHDVTVHLIVDASASMGFGAPQKIAQARMLAAALAWVSLTSHDRARLHVLGASPVQSTPAFVGRAGLRQLMAQLALVDAAGTVSLGEAVTSVARLLSEPGIVFLLSDFLSEGAETAIERLTARRHQVHALRVLAPQELEPSIDDALRADMELVDCETQGTIDVTLSPRMRAIYRETLAAHEASLRAACRRTGATLTLLSSADPVEAVVLRQLQAQGIVG